MSIGVASQVPRPTYGWPVDIFTGPEVVHPDASQEFREHFGGTGDNLEGRQRFVTHNRKGSIFKDCIRSRDVG